MDFLDFELKNWTSEYIDDLMREAENIQISRYLSKSFESLSQRANAEAFIKSCINTSEDKQCMRAIVKEGKLIGSIGMFINEDIYSRSGDIAYWISQDYWGKGIMTQIVKYFCTYLFDKYDIVRIQATPFKDNKGSCAVLEKAGFKCEGVLKKSLFKNGDYFDSSMYALIK